MTPLTALLGLALATCAVAREIPENLRDFYNGVRKRDSCGDKLATGFWSTDEDDSPFPLNTVFPI